MRVELVVLVRKTPENTERLEYLDESQWKPREGTEFLENRLPAHSDRAKRLLAQLAAGGFEYYMREERHFDLAEIRRAKILKTCPERQIISAHLPNEVEFDWSEACEVCMRSPEQVGPLVMEYHRFDGEAAVLGPRHELIVNETIATRMIKDGVSGCLLREIKAPEDENEPESPYFQVIVTNDLPPAFCPPTRFLTTEDRCEECGQGGLFLDSALYYDVEEECFSDLNHTYETFGQGSGISPEILLSTDFYNLLLACGANLEEPEPVMFV